MPQQEYIPQAYARLGPGDDNLRLQSSDSSSRFNFEFEALSKNVFRTTFTSDSHPLPPHPSIVRKQLDAEFRDLVKATHSFHSFALELDEVEASVDWSDTPVVSLGWKAAPQPLHADLPGRSYVADGPGVAHYSRHDRKALHVGLGEKAAPMDLTGRHFIMSATDCFGYDVYKTDPTYKHIPLLVKATPSGCVAIVSSSYSRGSWAVGSEIDGLWRHFKTYRQDYGGLEEYLIIGRTLKEVVYSYAQLVGFPLLAPKWAFGYISGGYRYTMGDDPPAHVQLREFADKLEEHGIPCSAHQMSSGYSIAEHEPKVRNVFTWNRHRFPDPEAWTKEFHSRGMRLLANIKPFVLKSHPDYDRLVKAKGLFIDPRTNDTATMKLWSAGGGESGLGSHIDFTSAEAYDWWYAGCQMLRRQGVDGMWNDNNEYTLPNDDWTLSLSAAQTEVPSTPCPNKVGYYGRALHAELMGRASCTALSDLVPHERPFVLTRSATIGTTRYCASSWSGDNVTSWPSMRGANAQSLNAGVSLLHCYGHDIGGFEGPQPSPELLLRWIQIGCYQPRFAINCFKTSPTDNQLGEVIEPWMYPSITPLVRKAIKRRYEMLPYLYSLGIESHLFASPPMRWVGWGHETDSEVWSNETLKRGEDQFWLGDGLLVAGVYEPGQTAADVYLPRKSDAEGFDFGYVNTNEPYQYLASGQWVKIDSAWKESIPILARIGSVLPVGRDVQTRLPGEGELDCKTLPEDDWRGVEIFPPRNDSNGTVFESSWYEDDGYTVGAEMRKFTVRYSSTAEKVIVGFKSEVERRGSETFVPPWKDLDFILLPGDARFLVSELGIPLEDLGLDQRGRARWRFKDVV